MWVEFMLSEAPPFQGTDLQVFTNSYSHVTTPTLKM